MIGLNSRRAMHGCLLALTMLFVAPSALAEKADRTLDVEIEADRIGLSDEQTNAVLEGNVVLTQGTLRIVAARMVVKKDGDKQVFAEIFGTAKQQVTFREKREGQNDFIEGSSDRAEFDQRASTVKLLANATIKSGGDVLTGEYIFYNTESERFDVMGKIPNPKAGEAPTGTGRSRLVFKPRTPDPKTVDKK